MATKKDKARLNKVSRGEAREALSKILNLDPCSPDEMFIKPVKSKISCRKRKSSENLSEYLWIIGAGVVLGHVQPKALNKVKFYQSWEWKKLRYKAIRASSQRCMCCGWQVGDTQHGYLVVDHIKPRSKFPELALDPDNLQVLCNDCNMGKSNDSFDDWRETEVQFRAALW